MNDWPVTTSCRLSIYYLATQTSSEQVETYAALRQVSNSGAVTHIITSYNQPVDCQIELLKKLQALLSIKQNVNNAKRQLPKVDRRFVNEARGH